MDSKSHDIKIRILHFFLILLVIKVIYNFSLVILMVWNGNKITYIDIEELHTRKKFTYLSSHYMIDVVIWAVVFIMIAIMIFTSKEDKIKKHEDAGKE